MCKPIVQILSSKPLKPFLILQNVLCSWFYIYSDVIYLCDVFVFALSNSIRSFNYCSYFSPASGSSRFHAKMQKTCNLRLRCTCIALTETVGHPSSAPCSPYCETCSFMDSEIEDVWPKLADTAQDKQQTSSTSDAL